MRRVLLRTNRFTLLITFEGLHTREKSREEFAASFGIRDHEIKSMVRSDFYRKAYPIFEFAMKMKRFSQEDYDRLLRLADETGLKITFSPELYRYYQCWGWENKQHLEFEPFDAGINLGANEACYFGCAVEWKQPRVTQTTVYVGGSSKGVFGAIPISYENKDITTMSDGMFYLTNKRMMFVGDVKSTTITGGKIIQLELYTDGVKVNKSSGKPDYFTMSEEDAIVLHAACQALDYI